MKKVSLFLSLMLISILAFSQVVPTEVLRIANDTTAMGVNISVGKLIYDINADLLYVSNVGVVSTLTLTTGSASFTLINPNSATTNLTEGTVTETTVDVNSSTGTNATLVAASASRAGVMTKAKFDEVVLNNDKVTNVSTALSTGTVGNSTYGITSDGGTDDVVLAAATTEAAGVMTSTDKSKLDGLAANFTLFTEKFEETSGTATEHSLAQTAQTAGATVSLNGSMLDPANYTLTASTLEIDIAVLQYDIVVVTYNY